MRCRRRHQLLPVRQQRRCATMSQQAELSIRAAFIAADATRRRSNGGVASPTAPAFTLHHDSLPPHHARRLSRDMMMLFCPPLPPAIHRRFIIFFLFSEFSLRRPICPAAAYHRAIVAWR